MSLLNFAKPGRPDQRGESHHLRVALDDLREQLWLAQEANKALVRMVRRMIAEGQDTDFDEADTLLTGIATVSVTEDPDDTAPLNGQRLRDGKYLELHLDEYAEHFLTATEIKTEMELPIQDRSSDISTIQMINIPLKRKKRSS